MGRCSNIIGTKLGKVTPWKIKLGTSNSTTNEYLFLKQIEYFFFKPFVINLHFILCQIDLCKVNNIINLSISLYDSKEYLQINIYKRSIFKDSNFKNLKEFINNYNYYSHFSVYQYNYFRLALVERGLLLLGKKYFSEKVKVNFKVMTNANVTALLIGTYLCVKLKQQYFMRGLLSPVRQLLDVTKGILGYRIEYSGRFDRRPRATYQSVKGGSLSFSQISSNVDYIEKIVILKFGKCGIKVWLKKGDRYKSYESYLNIT